jgi:hypothetical protein
VLLKKKSMLDVSGTLHNVFSNMYYVLEPCMEPWTCGPCPGPGQWNESPASSSGSSPVAAGRLTSKASVVWGCNPTYGFFAFRQCLLSV